MISDLTVMIKDPLGENHIGNMQELTANLDDFLGTEDNIFTQEELTDINEYMEQLSYYEEEVDQLNNYGFKNKDDIRELKQDISEFLKPFRLYLKRLAPKLAQRYDDMIEELYSEES